MESAHVQLLNTIECIGIDDRRHFCTSWSDVTFCGVKIHSKKTRMLEYRDDHPHYNCGHCDSAMDELVEAEDKELRENQVR